MTKTVVAIATSSLLFGCAAIRDHGSPPAHHEMMSRHSMASGGDGGMASCGMSGAGSTSGGTCGMMGTQQHGGMMMPGGQGKMSCPMMAKADNSAGGCCCANMMKPKPGA